MRRAGPRPARAAAAGRAGPALHDAGDHGPDAGRGAAGTDPAWTGAADQFQLRLRGRARGLHARFVRARPAARAAGARARSAARRRRQIPAPRDHHRTQWGGDSVPPRSAPVLRPGPARVRPPHRQRERLRARGLGGDGARDHQVPPRPQRLERRRLQLPRRPVRPDLRGPGRRHRPGDRRRAGAGLQQRLDRRRVPRHVHRRPADRGRPGGRRTADRLEALAPRHPDRGRSSRSRPPAARRTGSPRARPSRSSASPAIATATTTSCPGDVLYAQLPDLRAARRALRRPDRRADRARAGDAAARRRHHHAQRRPALPRRQLAGRPARRAPVHAPRAPRPPRCSRSPCARPTARGASRSRCRGPARSAPASPATATRAPLESSALKVTVVPALVARAVDPPPAARPPGRRQRRGLPRAGRCLAPARAQGARALQARAPAPAAGAQQPLPARPAAVAAAGSTA